MSAKIHGLKIWPEWFEDVASRQKCFEIRRADRDFQIGDYLLLREYDPELNDGAGMYTGRSLLCRVPYILEEGGEAIPGFHMQGFEILGIELMEWADEDYDDAYLNNKEEASND